MSSLIDGRWPSDTASGAAIRNGDLQHLGEQDRRGRGLGEVGGVDQQARVEQPEVAPPDLREPGDVAHRAAAAAGR